MTAAVAMAPPILRLLGARVSDRPARAADEEGQELVRRVHAGDPQAFRDLFRRYRAEVMRLLYRMLGPRADLDDVLQEVFLQVHRSLRDYRGEAKLSTWLHRVTVNVALMQRRSAKSRPVLAEEAPADLTPDDGILQPDEDAARRERVRAFFRLLEQLAEKKRVVFVLHELEGLSPQQIATVVDAPVLTVRTRLFYARRELEALLGTEPSLANMDLGFARDAKSGADESEELP
jgi:RNA polymerase sigma-70 factor, ECF subfamily